MTEVNNTQQARYVQLPELIEMFKNAPRFVARKCFKAIPLSENGELMVETQITEHMAAGLATTAQEVQKGEYALIHEDLIEKIRPLLNEYGAVSPVSLLDNHIEVMDVATAETLEKTAVINGALGTITANIYPDPILHAIIAPEEMNIPSFMDPMGVESIAAGQLLIRNKVLGVFPYQRPHHSLTADTDFLENHLPVNNAGLLITFEESPPHQALASALMANVQTRQGAQNQGSWSTSA